jgi:microcystin degradation protein MlrC
MAVLPRIALIGLHLESNSFAPPTTEADFRRLCYLEGAAIVEEAAKQAPAMPLEVPGFVKELARLDFAWEPVPILVTGAEPGGPVEHAFFEDCVRRIVAGLRSAGRIDAVYLTNHGAMTSTAEFDPDGVLYAAVRAEIGRAPFVASVDLHANISDRMIDSVDAFVSYRTNPHVDQLERGAECARHVAELLQGGTSATALVRLPLTPASVTLLTASGPYADLMNAAEARMASDERLMNLSVVGGLVGIIAGFLAAPSVVGLRSFLNTSFPDAMKNAPEAIMTMVPIIVPWSIPLAFGISVFVGVVFGLYPASKAAAMNPIDALRHVN